MMSRFIPVPGESQETVTNAESGHVIPSRKFPSDNGFRDRESLSPIGLQRATVKKIVVSKSKPKPFLTMRKGEVTRTRRSVPLSLAHLSTGFGAVSIFN